MSPAAIFCTAMMLGACAAVGPAGYGPADASGFGFSETRIEDGRYRIVYRGSAGMPPEMVEDFALRRASELAAANDYDWFKVVSLYLEGEERGGVGIGAGVGTGSYGRRSGVSVGVGGNLGQVGAKEYFTARLEVIMGAGEKPEGNDVFDAGSVFDALAPADPYLEE